MDIVSVGALVFRTCYDDEEPINCIRTYVDFYWFSFITRGPSKKNKKKNSILFIILYNHVYRRCLGINYLQLFDYYC